MTGFSVFRQVFGKGANKELTVFLLHFWDSSQDQQGLSWDQHSPEWGSEAFELEWAEDGVRGCRNNSSCGEKKEQLLQQELFFPRWRFQPLVQSYSPKNKVEFKIRFYTYGSQRNYGKCR